MRLIVANHVSWLDVPVLGSIEPMTFLAKSEVGAPALGGRLARLQGIILVERGRRRCIPSVNAEMARTMAAGEPVVMFAEATTGDGNRILPFRSSHFEAIRAAARTAGAAVIQPVFLDYSRVVGLAVGRSERPLFAWYGDALPALRRGRPDALRRPLRAADRGFGRNRAENPGPLDRGAGPRTGGGRAGRQLAYSRRPRFVVDKDLLRLETRFAFIDCDGR
jgi:1-acyl-sn-glycerol-3-phosphate acyltransferase